MKSKLLIITNSYNKVVKPQTVLICNKDGEAIKVAFEDKFEVHFEENVQTEGDTRAVIDQFVANCAEGPLHSVYFFFSGHGGSGKVQPPGYRETEGDFIITDNGKGKILVKEITQKICKIKARHKVYIFNCCRGHRTQGCFDFLFPKADIGEDITHDEEKNTWIIKASTPYHVALANNHPSRNTTLFSGLFLDALKQMRSQTDGESTDETESVTPP